jgi:hypothetical protein
VKSNFLRPVYSLYIATLKNSQYFRSLLVNQYPRKFAASQHKDKIFSQKSSLFSIKITNPPKKSLQLKKKPTINLLKYFFTPKTKNDLELSQETVLLN